MKGSNIKADILLMKELNKNNVRRQLRLMGKATKQELALRTGLSVVTINSLLDELVQADEVRKGENVPSNGGRPSMQYVFNENYKYAVIIYGHQKNNQNLIQLFVTNLLGQCIERKKQYFDQICVDSFDDWLSQIFQTYEEKISLIAFGLPGEEENGVITINDYKEIIGADFLKHYQNKFQVPIMFENDINAAVIGYYSYGISQDMDHVMGMYFPRIYNPGAGIIINGEIYRGAHHFAGEFLNIPVDYPWDKLDYTDAEQVVDAVGQLLTICSCVLAPECFVLYGDFWTEEIREALLEKANQSFQRQYQLKLIFSEHLERDFEQGMIKLALDEMERQFMKKGEALCF